MTDVEDEEIEDHIKNPYRGRTMMPRVWFIDECSMIGKELLGEMSTKMNKLYGCRKEEEKVMGGVHCIFSGDFLQLQPVCSTSLFTKPLQSKGKSTKNSVIGELIWQKMTYSIILNEQMRQPPDNGAFSDILDGLRYGNGMKWGEYLGTINSRVLAPKGPIMKSPAGSIIAAFKNVDVNSFIEQRIIHACNNGVFVVRLKMEMLNKNLELLTDISRKQVYDNYISTKKNKDKLPDETYVYTGMPLTIIASNPATKLGVVNGTACAFLKFEPEQQFHDVDIIMRNGERISTMEPVGQLSKMVMLVYVPGLKKQIPGLPEKIFPIFPVETTVTVSTHDSNGIQIKVRQFPIMPRFSLTGHKTQGQTMDSIVIHLPESPAERACIPGSWLYVQFSRVRRLDDLYLINPSHNQIHHLSNQIRKLLKKWKD